MLWDSAKVCVLAITIMQNSKKSHAYTYTLVRRCSQLNRLLRVRSTNCYTHTDTIGGKRFNKDINQIIHSDLLCWWDNICFASNHLSNVFFYCMNWIPLPVAFAYEERLKKLRVLVQTLEIATPCANKKDQSIKTVEVYIV